MLTFDEPTHTYRWDGKIVPSVTQVLSAWSTIAKLPQEILAPAAERGQIVHTLTQHDDEGDLDEDWAVEHGYMGYVVAWRLFRSKYLFMPISREQRIYHHELGYAGTYDAVGEAEMQVGRKIRKVRALFDIKSGSSDPVHTMQTIAYARATIDNSLVRGCVYLRANGDFAFEQHPNDQEDWADWLACLRHYHWRQRNGID